MNAKECHARINQNGRVVIPSSFRRDLGIKAGDTLVLRVEKNELRITTLQQRLTQAQAWMRKHVPRGRSLSDELIAERREAAKRE